MTSNGRYERVVGMVLRPGPQTPKEIGELKAEFLLAKERLDALKFPLTDLEIYFAGRRVQRSEPTPEPEIRTPAVEAAQSLIVERLAKLATAKLEKQRLDDDFLVTHAEWTQAVRGGKVSVHLQEKLDAAAAARADAEVAVRRAQGGVLNAEKARDNARRRAVIDVQQQARPKGKR